ncbi:molybdopterin-synthase adenylyltransferase MoeB [Paracrocinitomix mangrovi]|uniref:molybdopterin-synthase adenylyltransferase MoeB n=1 Tax=Paracrocinitomix mangrovi TaxID=2862509 RepID=UPI001C8DC7D9|nr:molybdopterin-synthase adenylyltransferase MoeB [Paracrocinitomix mangrovi]UKN03513.1 molybdopterin-synthase adenylyltransferase MoeB [Paracrocinitomix mangrovi]
MSKDFFSKKELERYSRHLILPDFNIEGQTKLKRSKVLVIGAGGLGAPLLQYLSAAGVGTIGIVDFDIVEESNLQRQVLFTTDDIGKPKVEVARDRILSQNPHIEVKIYNTKLTAENAMKIATGYDVIADGTDNFPTRYLVNDLAVLLKIPYVYASIYRFHGQLSVFNFIDKEGNQGPNYRDLFPKPPLPEEVPSCAEGGVIGVLAGIMGSLQANEVIKVIAEIGQPLSGKLLHFDALNFETNILKLQKHPESMAVTELIDYEDFCGVNSVSSESFQSIDVFTLKKWLDEDDIQLIDVREKYEVEIANINGYHIPKSEIQSRWSEVNKDKKVVIYCKSGKRSADVVRYLQDKHGYQNVYNLRGGILAWIDKIDKSLTKY